jgi:F0F1-type ATP synthase membrane subunit b/b'
MQCGGPLNEIYAISIPAGAVALVLGLAKMWFSTKIPDPIDRELKAIKKNQEDSDKKVEVYKREHKEHLIQISNIMDDSIKTIAETIGKQECPAHKHVVGRITALEKSHKSIGKKLNNIDKKVSVMEAVKETLDQINGKIQK